MKIRDVKTCIDKIVKQNSIVDYNRTYVSYHRGHNMLRPINPYDSFYFKSSGYVCLVSSEYEHDRPLSLKDFLKVIDKVDLNDDLCIGEELIDYFDEKYLVTGIFYDKVNKEIVIERNHNQVAKKLKAN